MEFTVASLIKFLAAFAAMSFLLYVITANLPKIASKIDAVIEKNKSHHSNEDDDLYKVRGIYDLPPSNEKNNNENGDDSNG